MDVGMAETNIAGKLDAVGWTRHHDIGEQHVELFAFKDANCFARVFRFFDLVAQAAQHADSELARGSGIFDDKYFVGWLRQWDCSSLLPQKYRNRHSYSNVKLVATPSLCY